VKIQIYIVRARLFFQLWVARLFILFTKTAKFIPPHLENMHMLSGCELIDTENISLPSQNMKFFGE
jgi:hypothetical protein